MFPFRTKTRKSRADSNEAASNYEKISSWNCSKIEVERQLNFHPSAEHPQWIIITTSTASAEKLKSGTQVVFWSVGCLASFDISNPWTSTWFQETCILLLIYILLISLILNVLALSVSFRWKVRGVESWWRVFSIPGFLQCLSIAYNEYFICCWALISLRILDNCIMRPRRCLLARVGGWLPNLESRSLTQFPQSW